MAFGFKPSVHVNLPPQLPFKEDSWKLGLPILKLFERLLQINDGGKRLTSNGVHSQTK